MLSLSSPAFKTPSLSRLFLQTHPYRCPPTKPLPFSNPNPTQIRFGFSSGKTHLGLPLKAVENGGEGGGAKRKSIGGVGADIEAGELSRGEESTMPERFRYLTKEAPDPPLRWPWFVGTLYSDF